MIPTSNKFAKIRIGILACLAFVLVCFVLETASSFSQDIIDADDIQSIMNDQPTVEPDATAPATQPQGIDLLELIRSGGGFMIPIGLMSLLVVALATERLVTLRRAKIVPTDLIDELEELAEPINRFSPGVAYQVCSDNPSPASRVVTAMLLRTGQSLGEIEKTASETAQREAETYAAPIRWLNLAAAATPLMGLLGTVWGMIVAFHESTTLSADRSRSEQLSEGIYTALVTTLAGLIVAIPAAILAQYLENRVIKLFHRVEQLAFDIAPGLARFQGVKRMDTDGSLHPLNSASVVVKSAAASTATPTPPPPPQASPAVRSGAKLS